MSSYDLQLHLVPAESKLSAIARLVVRNDSSSPLRKLALQISSTLHWDGASVREEGSAAARVSLEQHRIDTDTDHTGAADEGILQLQAPLRPGGTAELVLIYSGTVEQSAARLVRAGESIDSASATDWDRIGSDEVALRGFGHVLWYPVAAPQAFLETGAQLAESVAAQRRREADARVRLRLEMEGPAPAVAFFCGLSAPVSVVNQGMARGGEADAAEMPTVSTAEWTATTLGFGAPSLFVTAATTGSGSTGPVTLIGASQQEAQRVQAAAQEALPLITSWLGATRERVPTLLNHVGEPFAQRALLVESAQEAGTSFAMTHLESHAWFSSPEVWLDEGVAQLLPLVALEARQGRPAAIAQLRDLQPALSLGDSGAKGLGESLVHASREVTFRNKAVSVLWMLRGMVGDAALGAALQSLKQRPEAERTAESLERELERATGKKLQEFFHDWVFADNGLPDLSIVSAIPRPVTGMPGRPDGNLVAVEVRNEGHVAADVPVSVRSGTLSATERLHVPALSTASVRILFQGQPEVVEVNDGTVPEIGSSEHELTFNTRPTAADQP